MNSTAQFDVTRGDRTVDYGGSVHRESTRAFGLARKYMAKHRACDVGIMSKAKTAVNDGVFTDHGPDFFST